MPYFDIGFMPFVLDFIDEILGSTHVITIDTGIGAEFGDDSDDIIKIHGSNDHPITYKDVHHAFKKMFKKMDEVQRGDYDFSITGPHINCDKKGKKYSFKWDT